MMLCLNHKLIMAIVGILLFCTAPTTTTIVHALRNSINNNNNKILQHRQNVVKLPHNVDDNNNRINQDLISTNAGNLQSMDDETERQVEDVFRRLQDGGKNTSGNSFLDQHLSHNTAYNHYFTTSSDGGDDSGHIPQHHNSDYYYYYDQKTDIAVPQTYGKPPPNRYGSGKNNENQVNNHHHPPLHTKSDNTKGAKSNQHSSIPKKYKKEKKHREEDKTIHKKLAKDGYFDDDMWSNEEADTGDYYYDTWHYNDWAWEYDQEWEEEEQNYHNSTSQGGPVGAGLFRFGPSGSKEDNTSFNNPTGNIQDNSDASVLDLVGGPQGRSIDSFSGIQNDRQDNIQTKQFQMSSKEFLPQIDYVPSSTQFQFNFPKIQHRLYSGPVLLKAHSAMDLSEVDPEIFAVLQSVLTPYLQTTAGSTLHSYTLEVDYSPGNDQVAQGMVVTNLQVTVTLKVMSDSIESIKSMNHTQASQWIRDFFSGPELDQLITALGKNNIPVNEIVFLEQEFKTPLSTGGQVIAGISGDGGGTSRPSNTTPSSSGNKKGSVVIGITLALLAVGAVLFLHFTGRLPSKSQFHRFRRSVRDSLSSGTRSFQDEDGHDDFDLKVALADIHNVEEGGKKQRNRTWSGTFRRYPPGGIRPAAIQKEPARSEDYLGDSSSKGSSSRSSSTKASSSGSSSKDLKTKDSKRLTKPSTGYDDYSFAVSVGNDFNVDGDYGPMSPRSPNRRRNPQSPTASTPSGHDEFSMPEEYDTVAEDQASLYSKWSQSVNVPRFGMQPTPPSISGSSGMMSPFSASPRKVTTTTTPYDTALSSQRRTTGGGLGDEWSLASFDAQSPSARQMYRDFNGGSTSDSRENDTTPLTATTTTSSSWWGLSLPKFT